MSESRQSSEWAHWELTAVLLLVWLVFISIPLSNGNIGISSDALNHHIYLGWSAEHPRFDKDFLAVSYQAYQFPYLYWPVYKLAMSGVSGVWAGVVLATLHMVVVPPVWMIARTCIPGKHAFDVLLRLLAVILAFATSVVLMMFDATSNDLLAAAPFVWAVALALEPLNTERASWLTVRRAVVLSGVLAGASVACKLSNGPLAVLLPLLWFFLAISFRARVFHIFLGGLAAVAGFILIYGYWGWQLWSYFGNPVYPFYDPWFVPVRELLSWKL